MKKGQNKYVKKKWLYVGLLFFLGAVIGLTTVVYVLESESNIRESTLIVSLLIALVGGLSLWFGWVRPITKITIQQRDELSRNELLSKEEHKIMGRGTLWWEGRALGLIGIIIVICGLVLFSYEQFELATLLIIIGVILGVLGLVYQAYGGWYFYRVFILFLTSGIFAITCLLAIAYTVRLYSYGLIFDAAIFFVIGFIALVIAVFLFYNGYHFTRKIVYTHKSIFDKIVQGN